MNTNERILAVAFSQIGTAEIVGSKHEPMVLRYFHDIGHKWVDDDETPWCAAFANWVCLKALVENTGKLNARSFMEIGEPVELHEAQAGDVVILWRESKTSAKGHVGFLTGQDASNVCLLGGNQNNEVGLGLFPKGRVLGVRRLNSKFTNQTTQDS